MKCIRCGTDNTLKDRTHHAGSCKNCGHRFVFEPTQTTGIKITDTMFGKAILDVSANNTLWFTPQQLRYLLDSRLRHKSGVNSRVGWVITAVILIGFVGVLFLGGIITALTETEGLFWGGFTMSTLQMWMMFKSSQSAQASPKQRQTAAQSLPILGVIILALGIFVGIVQESVFQFLLSLGLGSASIYLGFRQSDRQLDLTQEFLITPGQLNQWLTQWQAVNGSIPQLLPDPQSQLIAADINPDVSAYSFDRLVVCQSAAIAQFLIANQFHFEHNCAILTITGYPEQIFSTTLEMVRRNPDLKVYALHDCSIEGVRLAHRLKHSPQWFQNSTVSITDVGLSPRQVLSYKKGMFIRTESVAPNTQKHLAEMRGELLPPELNWLQSGNCVELESFTPQKLIQILHRNIVDTRDASSEQGSDLFFVGDSGGYFYTSESFG